MLMRTARGLRTTLIVLVVVPFVPLVTLSGYKALLAREDAQEQARMAVHRLAEDATRRLEMHVNHSRVVLRTISENGFLNKSNGSQCASLLDSGLSTFETYGALLVLDGEGRDLCHSTPRVSSSAADRSYISEVMRLRRPLVGMPITGRITGKAVLPVAQPVLDEEGRVQRVLVAGLRIDAVLRQALEAFAPKEASFALISKSGNVLFRAVGDASGEIPRALDAAAAHFGAEIQRVALSERTDVDGVARIFAHGPPIRLAANEIFVVAGIDRNVVAERADQVFALDLVSILTLAGIMAIGVSLLGDRLVRRPVVELGNAARKLSAGDFSAKVDVQRFNGEFIGLAAAFNEMAACIQSHTRELRLREERVRLMTSCVKDYAIVMLDPMGRIATWSAAAQRLHGFSEQEVVGRPAEAFYSQDDVTRGAIDRLKKLAMNAGRAEARLLRLRKDGTVYHASVTLGAMRDHSEALMGFTEITRDISEQVNQEARRAASASRVRELLRRVVSVQEAERRALSADLHDLVGQHLSALGIEVENMRLHVGPDNARARESRESLDRMARLTSETMQAVRSTMAHLRPPLLDDYGLGSALVAFCRETERRSGFEVTVVQKHEIGRFSPDTELALFRIVQEAVSNSVKHSKGKKVEVTLLKQEQVLCIAVEDDGSGIAQREGARAARRGGWGLQIMRERAQALGGFVRVEFPGVGTRVVAEVPIEDQNHTRR